MAEKAFESNKTIVINGKTVPTIVRHADGKETWNLTGEEAGALTRAAMAQVMRALLGQG